jgi:hypothetical protein
MHCTIFGGGRAGRCSLNPITARCKHNLQCLGFGAGRWSCSHCVVISQVDPVRWFKRGETEEIILYKTCRTGREMLKVTCKPRFILVQTDFPDSTEAKADLRGDGQVVHHHTASCTHVPTSTLTSKTPAIPPQHGPTKLKPYLWHVSGRERLNEGYLVYSPATNGSSTLGHGHY